MKIHLKNKKMKNLKEKALLEHITAIELDASLVSRKFWQSLGFTVKKEDYVPVRNNQKLVYYKMFKII